MPLHFAPARTALCSPLARILCTPATDCAANDNGELAADDKMIEAALRHFAKHGIGAAREARKQAEKAFFSDDMKAYDWWLGICRTLDRRMADGLKTNAN